MASRTSINIVSRISDIFTNAIRNSFPSLDISLINPAIEQNYKPQMKHDYQCNAAMSLCKILKEQKIDGAPSNPRAVGQSILDKVPTDPLINKVELTGPGYLNVYLSRDYVADLLTTILRDGKITYECTKKHNVVIDYSSPNIAKDMHVGHLRSTIIGDSLARILEYCGHHVDRINHLGDWGTQFGMLICNLKDNCPNFKSVTPDITDLTKFYKDAKSRFDRDADFKERSQLEVVKLQSHDEEDISIWKLLCSMSEKMFQDVYKRLNIDSRLKSMGESFYNPFLSGVVIDLQSKNLLQDSEGAKVMFVEGVQTPLMIQKKDGGFGYDSTDMACIKYRVDEMKGDWLIYVVDLGQSLHFNLLFQAARTCGYVRPEIRLDHVGFGVVQGDDKKRLKTRSGETQRLVDLLDISRDRALEIIRDRISKGSCHLTDEDYIKFASEQLGYGGVKYFDLRQNRTSDYVFSYDRMLSPDGDTNVFLQYTYARVCSILRKSDTPIESIINSHKIVFTNDSEYELGKYLLNFNDVIQQIERDLYPHKLCNYLYAISTKLSVFYRDCKVIGSPEQNSRLLLCKATALIMETGFKLLGLVPLEQI